MSGPDWAPPDDVAGQPVDLSLVLANTASAAVRVEHFVAYPTGFGFEVIVVIGSPGHVSDPMRALGALRRRPLHGCEPADDDLQFRLVFSDESEAVSPLSHTAERATKVPPRRIGAGAGTAGNSVARTTFWVWPLPPPGRMVFMCEWPRYEIALSRHEVNADLIREAASRVAPGPDSRP